LKKIKKQNKPLRLYIIILLILF